MNAVHQLKRLMALRGLALGLSLATMGMAFHSQAATPVDGVVAQVEDGVILRSDLDQAIAVARARLTEQGTPIPDAATLKQDVLDQLILRQIMLAIIQRTQAVPEAGEVDEALLNIAQQRGASNLADLQARLDAAQPGAYANLRRQVAENIAFDRLRQQRVGSRVRVTDIDIDNFLKSPESQQLFTEQYRFNQILSPSKDAAARRQMSQVVQKLRGGADIQRVTTETPNVQGGGTDWVAVSQLPPAFASALQRLAPGQVSDVLEVPQGLTVLQLIQKRGGERTSIVQRQARHILVKTSAVVSNQAARARLDDIIRQLKGGADFATLARTYSEDPGSARNGGELGWVTAGEMVPPFEQALFATPVGTLSAPVQTPYGWHVILVEGERNQDVTDTYRRNLARQALSQRQFARELQDWLREIRSAAYVKLIDQPSA